MSKAQKRVLVGMAIVMLLVLGAVVLAAYSSDYNRKMDNFQQQINSQLTRPAP